MATGSDESQSAQREFAKVKRWLSAKENQDVAGKAIRLAIDWVIDGARTQRYSIDQLKTTERIYIGNRVEHELLFQWGLPKVGPLDTLIEGVPADIKFSMTTAWMIPPEALGKLCVIVTAADASSSFAYGLFRALPEWLASPNRDAKRGITKAGREAIEWIVPEGSLPPNFLLHLSGKLRDRIFAQSSGQARVTELFRLVHLTPIPTTAIDTIAVQRDPSKRIRDARKALIDEGIEVLGWRYDKERIEALGSPRLEDDDWIAIPTPKRRDR